MSGLAAMIRELRISIVALNAVVSRTALELLRDFRFAMFGCGAVALFIISTYAGVAEYGRSMDEYGRLRAAAFRHSGLESMLLIRVPSRFLFMSEGGERSLPNVLIALPGYVDAPHSDVAAAADLLPRGMPLDWSFAVAYLFSLAVLMSTHDVIARQRQNGTLRVVLSYPVKRVVILAGEYAGTLAVIIPLLLVAFFGGVVVVLQSGQIAWEPSDWVRFGAFVVLSILFLSFVAAAGLLISIVFRDPMTCLLTSLLCWVVAGVAIPAMAQPLAHLIAPAESPRAHTLRLEAARLKFGASIRVSSEMLEPVVTSSGLSEAEKERRLRDIQLQLVEQHEASIERYTKELIRIRAAYLATVENEAALARRLASASPLYYYASLTDDIAGAGVLNERSFYRAAIEFTRRYTPACLALRQQLRPFAAVSGPTVEDGQYRLQGVSSVSYEDVQYDRRGLPEFSGYQVPVNAAGSTAFNGATLLISLTGLLLGLANNRLNRYVVA
jgi:ABC-type transport system involved in multi-copper enzyme maturation permease subunit